MVAALAAAVFGSGLPPGARSGLSLLLRWASAAAMARWLDLPRSGCGCCRCATLCRSPYFSVASAAATSRWRRAAASRRGRTGRCASKRTRPHDEDAVSAPAVLRRFRRRGGFALSGAARDPVVLVSDLAGAARRAGAGQPADRRPAGAAQARRRPAARRRLRAGRDAHLDPVLRLRREGRRGAEGRQSRGSRSGWSGPRSRSNRKPASPRRARSISSPARSSISPAREVAEGRHFAGIDGLSYRDGAGGIVHNRARAVLEDMDRLPFVTEVYKRDLTDRGLFHRLSEAPVCVALYRARLPVEMHLLPVAADRRRAPLPGAQRRRT